MKKPTVKKLKKRLDVVFSLWVRNRDNGVCFTCGKQGEIKEMQNGHYVSRANMSLRFDEINCHCQCLGCNIFKKGNMDEYAFRLEEMYGPSILKELRIKKYQTKQFTVKDLEELIEKYSA